MVRLVVGDGHPVEVLREQPCVLVVCGSLVVGCCLARHDLVLIPLSRLAPVLGLVCRPRVGVGVLVPCWGWCGGFGGGWWVVGWLLVENYTVNARASLWSSCQGRTVDALAPGADEGRGRPR